MKRRNHKRWWCGILTVAMLAGSLSGFLTVDAQTEKDETSGTSHMEWTEYGTTDASEGDGQVFVTQGDLQCETGADDAQDTVTIQVDGEAVVEGIDQNGRAPVGGTVSIEVTQPGYALVRVTEDENGAKVYTAMPLDTVNRYVFTAKQNMAFLIADPEQSDFAIRLAESRKAKLTGVAGLKLNSLASSAQGYDEIVLNLTSVKNGSDGTDSARVYYEVKVTAVDMGVEMPAGSPKAPVYYYIPKITGQNEQSKSVKVNDGELSEPTACTYEIEARMVLIPKLTAVPSQDACVKAPVEAELVGNTIIKRFSTKNLYYEDKIGFQKKTTRIYTGQQDVLAGRVKYSKNASYLHDLTAVAYNSDGSVCTGLTCSFRNDNDELYVSSIVTLTPGNYKIVVYAGIGEDATKDSPQGGSMYQANTSFTMTVMPGISQIDTSGITKQAAVNNRDISFSAVPVGYSYYKSQKAKTQKFTYEIKSAFVDTVTGEFFVTDPVDKVRENVSVNKNGKVTVKRGYYVSPDPTRNYIAVVIRGADYAGNPTTAIAYVQLVVDALVPTQMYLVNSGGNKLFNLDADAKQYVLGAEKAHGAKVVVLDQYGNNMNQYVDITPTDNSGNTAAAYVEQSAESGEAFLYVRKPTTVTLKAVTKDGGKKTMTLKLEIIMPEFTSGYYTIDSVTCDGFAVEGVRTGDGEVHYKALRNVVIRYRQGAKINGTGCFHWGWFDWKFACKGGTVKRDGEYLEVRPTEKKTEVTMWLKSEPDNKYWVEFINDDWDVHYDELPEVKLISGKLYSNKYTNQSDVVVDETTGNYTVPAQRLCYHYDFGSYDKVCIGAVSRNAPELTLENFDPAKRRFDLVTDAEYVKPGTYQYKVAFYIGSRLMGKPASITVKVTKSAQVKIQPNYTVNIDLENGAELKCKPGDFTPDFSPTLLNANVAGKSNGFNRYFRLNITRDDTGKVSGASICPRADLTDEDKEAIRGKKMVGYVKYSYYSANRHVKNVTAKIVVKVK